MRYRIFAFLASLFCVSLVVSNIIAGKLYSAPFGLVLPAAVWLFPIVYILGDVIPEVYGLAQARQVIWMGFFLNLFAVLFFLLTNSLPHPDFWSLQSSFESVLGFTPRLLFASFVAFLIGTNVNALILVKIKELTNGKFLWLRTIASTIVGESLDSAIFISIAFLGSMPLSVILGIIGTQALFKITYEVLATPITYFVVSQVKKYENSIN